ncbi:methyltransferase domain-containing protein [Paenibacillus sediminis]|uniref:tRNA G10 N-methylase Trm11 n=1 Tax=Paenibacillus sediminis TaxID=664909 RepID=A0ABS4H5K1_9BACL|nr:methyltransferase domain-containing protein [Paenibacillus sediminis]MBP1937360.1 tRNA G10 N-methylase Trm11 [Paenibacillus sediminis]
MKYIYTYACPEEELELCRMSLAVLFGSITEDFYIESERFIDPSHSPFIRSRIQVTHEANSLEELCNRVKDIILTDRTFKIVFMKTDDTYSYTERRAVEREIGQHITGEAQMKGPDITFGLLYLGDRWVLGECQMSEAVWLHHMNKPQNYSTALSTRVARAVVNVAVPDSEGKKVIDPCCGIGTVLVEALSMGIDIVGFDVNPLAVKGARVNLAHFGYPNVVKIADMTTLEGNYDAAIVDMPYNVCSVISPDEQLRMLQSARKLTKRLVLVTVEDIDDAVIEAGFNIKDRCNVRKGNFKRQVLLCE